MSNWLKSQFEYGVLMRRIVLIWAMVITTYTLCWTLDFADTNAASAQAAFIIASVWTPITAVLGWIFGSYTRSRQ